MVQFSQDEAAVTAIGRRRVLRLFAALPAASALSAAGLLGACGSAPPPPTVWAAPRFSEINPIWLHAGSLEIQDGYLPALKAPNIESTLPVSLGDTAALWARTRLMATQKSANVARMTFTRAAVTETPLERTGGISGMFTRDQVARVDTDLIGELEIFGPGGLRSGFAQARVTRGRTIPEDATLNERTAILNTLVNETATAFGEAMERKIRADLSQFIAFPPAS